MNKETQTAPEAATTSRAVLSEENVTIIISIQVNRV